MRAQAQSFGIFQIAVLVLSIYALAALLVDLIVPLSPETRALIQFFDYIVCAVFFIDFLHQLYIAPSKLQYLKFGWIDLLASIPAIDAFRWGRAFRVLRILRLLRAIRGTQKLYKLFRVRTAIGGSVALSALMVIILSSLAVLAVENSERSNIKTAGEALWWSITTATTVGYGDLYPVTMLGRLVAAFLMVAGVGLFGSLTALIASYFTAKTTSSPEEELKPEEQSKLLLAEIRLLRMEVETLRQKLSEDKGGS